MTKLTVQWKFCVLHDSSAVTCSGNLTRSSQRWSRCCKAPACHLRESCSNVRSDANSRKWHFFTICTFYYYITDTGLSHCYSISYASL